MPSLIKLIDKILRRYTPDPIVFALVLTFLAITLSLIFTEATFIQSVNIWGSGFWNLLSFTMQMAMILLGGFVVATSPPVQKFLSFLCRLPRSPGQAIILTVLIACIASWLNWGLGLVTGAVVALEMSRKVPKVNFRVLVAAAYSGFIMWHSGLSGSIPLLLNSKGNFTEEFLPTTIPLSQTIFSLFNISLVVTLLFVLIALNYWLGRSNVTSVEDEPEEFSETRLTHLEVRHQEAQYSMQAAKDTGDISLGPAEKIENSIWPCLIIFALAGVYFYSQITSNNFRLGLNQINYILLFVGLLFHKNIKSYLGAVNNGAGKLGPILVQYPFYAAIMAVLTGTGLATLMSQFFINVSSATTFPFFTFLSAGLVNVFVPSGGGQWAIQGPIVLPAMEILDANLTKTVMAVAWGDAWTNLLQPFWALPLLAIANLKIRDIIGFCMINLFVSGLVISAFLLLF